MKLSARNQFKGTIVDIQEGAVNGIVKIDIGGGNVMSATISMTTMASSTTIPMATVSADSDMMFSELLVTIR